MAVCSACSAEIPDAELFCPKCYARGPLLAEIPAVSPIDVMTRDFGDEFRVDVMDSDYGELFQKLEELGEQGGIETNIVTEFGDQSEVTRSDAGFFFVLEKGLLFLPTSIKAARAKLAGVHASAELASKIIPFGGLIVAGAEALLKSTERSREERFKEILQNPDSIVLPFTEIRQIRTTPVRTTGFRSKQHIATVIEVVSEGKIRQYTLWPRTISASNFAIMLILSWGNRIPSMWFYAKVSRMVNWDLVQSKIETAGSLDLTMRWELILDEIEKQLKMQGKSWNEIMEDAKRLFTPFHTVAMHTSGELA